jgi:hypothetical protein
LALVTFQGGESLRDIGNHQGEFFDALGYLRCRAQAPRNVKILAQTFLQFDDVSDLLPRRSWCCWYKDWILELLHHESMACVSNAIDSNVGGGGRGRGFAIRDWRLAPRAPAPRPRLRSREPDQTISTSLSRDDAHCAPSVTSQLVTLVRCLFQALRRLAATVRAHRLAFWDAMLWASAQRAGVRHILTEDFQDGFVLQDVTFINPFERENDRLIETLLPR